MTLKVYNARKLHQPRMSDSFLADSVHTTLASLYNCTADAVSLNCTISERAKKDVHS